MKPRLLFELPVLRPPTARSFDVRPAALEQWLGHLPLGSVGESCRQIFLTLCEVNRTQHPLPLRLAFLERLAPPLGLILPALQRHYLGQAFPLAERAQQVARLAIDLQVELVVGYRLVLEGLNHEPWYQRWQRPRREVLAAHRILHYMSGILSDYQWQHLPYPRGVWFTVHRILRYTAQTGRARRPLPRLPGSDTTTTVLDAYKRVVLRALVPPSRLRPDQWLQLDRYLQHWLPLVRVRLAPSDHGFWIRLDSDAPPTELPADLAAAVAGAEGRHTVFDTHRLMVHMAELLASDAAALPPGLGRDGVDMLRNAWGGARSRHTERCQGGGAEVTLVAGVNSVYRTLAVAATGAAATAAGTTHDHITYLPVQPWLHREEAEPLQPAIAARIADHGNGGFGLELPPACAHTLKEGDIVGLRTAAAQPWELGYVCWLRAEAGRPVRLGVQHLAVEILPVEVTVRGHDGRSAPLGCLLGSTATGETALFMANLPDIEHKVLRLGYRGHETAIVLHERLDGSAGFSAFRFDTPGREEQAFSSAAQAQDMWRQRTEAPNAAAGEAARYNDVWGVL